MHALRESLNNALNRQDAKVVKKKYGYQGGKLGVLGVLAVQNQLIRTSLDLFYERAVPYFTMRNERRIFQETFEEHGRDH